MYIHTDIYMHKCTYTHKAVGEELMYTSYMCIYTYLSVLLTQVAPQLI